MEDQYNLIYNGKMLHGMDGYATKVAGQTNSIDTSDKPVGCAGSYVVPKFGSSYNHNVRGYIPLIPYINTDTYKLSFQFKDNGSTDTTQYTCLIPFDNRGVFINIEEVYPYAGGNTITTLTQDLNDGDYVIHLSSVANWNVSQSYYVFGITESAAWGDSRAIAWVHLGHGATIDTTNNTITLGMTTNGGSTRRTWQGGTYKAGSKVRQFSAGSTYIYPITWNTKPSDWTQKEVTFTKSNVNDGLYRPNFSYFFGFGTIYTKGKFADLRFENLSRPQIRIPNGTETIQLYKSSGYGIIDDYSESTSSVNQYGQLNTGMLSEGFLPVRYIRDWINGNKLNDYNHWCELQAFDRWGRNVAYAADDGGAATGTHNFNSFNGAIYTTETGEGGSHYNASRGGLNISNTVSYKPMHVCTIGTPSLSPRLESSKATNPCITIDLGIIHYIDTIKVWHHYGSSDTIYNNSKTEVSADGVNWTTVFDSTKEGEYAETADGHTITFDKLGTLYHASMRKGGETLVQDIIED